MKNNFIKRGIKDFSLIITRGGRRYLLLDNRSVLLSKDKDVINPCKFDANLEVIRNQFTGYNKYLLNVEYVYAPPKDKSNLLSYETKGRELVFKREYKPHIFDVEVCQAAMPKIFSLIQEEII